MENKNYYIKHIKFDNDLSFGFIIFPNGQGDQDKGFVNMGLCGVMSDAIRCCIISFDLVCNETGTVFRCLHRFNQNDKGIGQRSAECKLSKCKNMEKLTFKFVINSLQIRYRPYIDLPYVLCYPSQSEIQLKYETKFKWNANKSLLNIFKNCLNKEWYYSQIFDCWSILFYPNGYNEETKGECWFGLQLCSWPEVISKMKIEYIVKTNFDENEVRYENECHEDHLETSKTLFVGNKILREQLKDELTIDVQIRIVR